jgi:predicted nucleic acid-binding protein
VSDATLERLRHVFASNRFDRYMGRRARGAFVDLLNRNASLCQVFPSDLFSVPQRFRDGRNNAILALAVFAEADAIVACSPDLLARKSCRKIPIVTPNEFVSWYDPA